MSAVDLSIAREQVRVHNRNAVAGAPAIKIPKGAQGSKFAQTYRNNPVAFVHDCFYWKEDEGPTFYQDEILSEIVPKKRVTVRGPHGLGKTGFASWCILWFALTRDGDDWKCPTTASAWRQLTKFLWPEVHKWSRKLNWEKIGRNPFNERTEMLSLSLKLTTGEAFALASDQHTSIEGAHADSLLYIFDEAKAIPNETFDAAEGAFMGSSKAETYAVAISTPGEPVGRFYEIHKRMPGYEDWWVRHVKLEEAIRAGRIDQEKADQRMRQWGEKSALYQNRVLGEFCASDEDGVIPLAWIEAAQERWRQWHDGFTSGKAQLGQFKAVGVDVGSGSGQDKSVFAPRFEATLDVSDTEYVKMDIVPELRRNNSEDTMMTTGRVVGILRKHGGQAVVDVIGIGAGVVSRLREQNYNVVPFNASEGSDMTDSSGEMGFSNKRAAAWWNLREMLDPANNFNVAIPDDDTLTGDLTALHKKPESGGRIRMESKDDIKKRIGRSTDDGDAVVMAYYPDENEFIFA